MMRILAAVVAAVLCGGHAFTAQAQTPVHHLRLSFEADGTVSLAASGVSLREVLVEWARLCGCVIANAQNLGGSLDVPVQFDHAPQATVLASLLRKSAGYILTPRSAAMTGPSEFETVYVLATSNPVSTPVAYSAPPVTYGPAAYTPVVPPPTPGGPADELPPVTPVLNAPVRGVNVPGQPTATPIVTPGQVQTPATPGLQGPLTTSPNRFVPIVPISSTPSTPPPSTPEVPRPPGAVSTPSTAPVRP